jgi:all-trans-8'-apo-beta-carotenal 15,15'-oxygenase
VHPNGAYYNFGVRANARGKGSIDLYRIGPSGRVVQRGSIDVDFVGFVHDFALTERYALFFVSPLAVRNPFPALLGLQTFDEAMQWRPELGMKIHVVRLRDFAVQKVIEIDPVVAIHFGNAWEDSGRIHLDATTFEDFRVNKALRNIFTDRSDGAGDLVRFEIDPVSGHVASRKHEKLLPCEFPQWDPRRQCRPTRIVYLNGIARNGTDGFFNAVQRIDTHTGEVAVHDFGPGRFTSEAVFVPDAENGDERDGHVICAVYDATEHRSEIAILDADLQRVRAVVPLRNHIPHGFHCGYVDQRFV